MSKNQKMTEVLLLASTLLSVSVPSAAFTWSDTFIGYRYGTQFHEPGTPNAVRKNILQLTHVDGYSLGQNFVNLDILQSDSNDPANGSTRGATEFYFVYRHQLYLSKVFDRSLSMGPIKDVALTAGFDWSSKNTQFAPNRRLWVVGPTLKFDVAAPGYWDVSLLYGRESNHCGLGATICPRADVTFDPLWMLSTSWGVPFQLGSVPLKFQGFLNYTSAKGKDYAYDDTRPETQMQTSLMVDVGQLVASKKNTVWAGIGFEYWRNKFGNHSTAAGVRKDGISTNAAMLQLEWHF